MATTESARSVDGGKHTHEFVPTPTAGSITTTMLASSVYAATGTVAGASPDDTADGGTATTVARGDHRHAAPCAAPGNIAPDDSAAEGNSTSFARANHVHGITCGTPAALTKTATAAESSGTGFARDAHVHSTDALPWGVVGTPFSSTSSSSGFTANATTDMTMSVTVDSTRLYKVCLHSRWSITGTPGAWSVNFHSGGTLVDRLGNINEGSATDGVLDCACLWSPSSGTVTLDVRVVEVSGASTLTLVGAANVTRYLWVEDIGPR